MHWKTEADVDAMPYDTMIAIMIIQMIRNVFCTNILRYSSRIDVLVILMLILYMIWAT